MKLTVALTLLVFISLNLPACSKKEASSGLLKQVDYQGLHFPGTADTAKKDGFNDCRAIDDNEYICEFKGVIEFIGYKFKRTKIFLDKKPNLFDENNYPNLENYWAKVPEDQKKLTYKELSLSSDGIQDEACLKNYSEEEKQYTVEEARCHIGEFIATRLKENGWLEKCDSGTCDYYNKDTNFYVQTFASWGYPDSLSLVPLNEDLLTSNYMELKNTKDLKEKLEKEKQDFVKSMKK